MRRRRFGRSAAPAAAGYLTVVVVAGVAAPVTGDDGLLRGNRVAASPGHPVIQVHSDFSICATTEPYTRCPPVETRAWGHVVEVGHRSPTGRLELGDSMGYPVFPNLAFRGRGDYRIRVHHA
ncbi:hypothetical protein ACIBCT_05850 [Streptosporangium sp. NPDC050855]|uniref:hypothetical protein n=1 Tax=Streptosporangium sp. NPDC050855 TaxID=3366194 RepID=UPI00378E1DC7